MFSWGICEIFKNTYFTEHLQWWKLWLWFLLFTLINGMLANISAVSLSLKHLQSNSTKLHLFVWFYSFSKLLYNLSLFITFIRGCFSSIRFEKNRVLSKKSYFLKDFCTISYPNIGLYKEKIIDPNIQANTHIFDATKLP